MIHLSKTKLLAFKQCPRRLWLEVHQPDHRADSAHTQHSFSVGHEVGDIARQLYDPKIKGQLLDAQRDGFEHTLDTSLQLVQGRKPIFEAGFRAEGAIAFADIMLPITAQGRPAWKMVEVKSSGQVKDYHRDDSAIQAFVARSAGVSLSRIALAHIDTSWTYPGANDYLGLLKEVDLSVESFSRADEVKAWISDAQKVVKKKSLPKATTGAQCGSPYECGFIGYCQSLEPQAEFPVEWLPKVSTKRLREHLAKPKVRDLRDVPDDLLNATQLRVKTQHLSNENYFDLAGAKDYLASFGLPAYFIDFETINMAVPIWKGTRPFQQIPFQLSVHRIAKNGKLTHTEFLDLSGKYPAKPFAAALLDACGATGPVFVYNISFERSRIKELAERFPKLSAGLIALSERLVDLWPVAVNYFYSPSQQGSWSIKKVLPALVPELSYDNLDGVQDGGMAMDAFAEAIHPSTSAIRQEQLRKQLLAYCKLDTYAMVKMWQIFSDRTDLNL